MKRNAIGLTLIVVLAVLAAGCQSANYINRSFILNACVFKVAEDAMPAMRKMEDIQKEANGGKEPDETYRMSLYVKAAGKDNVITKGEAERAYKNYLAEIRIVLGALPYQVPQPK